MDILNEESDGTLTTTCKCLHFKRSTELAKVINPDLCATLKSVITVEAGFSTLPLSDRAGADSHEAQPERCPQPPLEAREAKDRLYCGDGIAF